LARKILLADDSVTAQNMGRKILTDAGYEVIAVNNGSAALKKIAEHKPDLIVLDVYMPGYSGLEVCQRIKENRETARIPVLLTVGKLEPFKPEEARRARADAFVVKPFEASELLTALSKLEDKIVPQPESYKPGRFAKAIASIEEPAPSEKYGDADEGWKARLRFPSRKNKTPEPQEDAPETSTLGGKGVRDMLGEEATRPKQSEPSKAAQPAEHSSTQFERAIPAGLPNDITPEEIAAITAAAAQLSGKAATVPGAETLEKIQEKIDEVVASTAAAAEAAEATLVEAGKTTDIEVSATSASEATSSAEASVQATKTETAGVSADVTSAADADEPAPMTFASAHGPEIETSSAIEAVASAVVPPTVSEPEHSEPVTQIEASKTEPEARAPETTEAAVVSVPPIEELAPAAEPISTPAESQTAELSVVAPAPEEAVASPDDNVESPVVVQDVQLTPVEAQSEPEKPADVASVSPEPVAAVAAPEPAIPAHDEDVMAALQTLIPAPTPGAATVSAIAEDAQYRVAGSSNELTYVGSPTGRSRWIAEEVALSAEESAISLEQEMERAYSAFAASEAARLLASSVLETFPGSQPVVPDVAAAIEEHPASSVSAQAESVPVSSDAAGVVPVADDTSAVSAMAFAASAGDSSSSASTTASAPPDVDSNLPAASSEVSATAAVPEPVMTASTESASQSSAIEPGEPASAASEHYTEETDHAGGMDDMGKNSEGFGFKMIRQSPAGTSKGTAKPETVLKENYEPAAAAAPEPAAMAAAAAAESAPAVAPGPAPTDPRAIASIVDSVLAELRPKIVEEIAKKLAGDAKKE